MANITRFNPFDDTLDDLFRGFLVRPVMEGASQLQIKMDVSEDDKAYKVRADMPGVKKEDIQVTIDGNQVSISAEVKQEKEERDGKKVLRSERHYGKVYRAFSLGHEVDDTAAEAQYTDGVLVLTLPKRTATAAKRLTVH
ncbi:MAG: Hsp20/alpha crystallin family protein [Pseudomonadota bacterium]